MQPSWKDADLDFFTFGRFISRKFCDMTRQRVLEVNKPPAIYNVCVYL